MRVGERGWRILLYNPTLRHKSYKYILYYQGVLVGAGASLLLVSWMVSGAQINIAQGNIKFPYLNMSTEGCPEDKNTTVNSVWKTMHHDG